MPSVLLSGAIYKLAMQSAEAKNPAINYATLQKDRSWTLIYNPKTKDGMFVKKLNVCTYLGTDYCEAYPQIGTNTALVGNIQALNAQGWPAIEGI